jgi:hypothetical protein
MIASRRLGHLCRLLCTAALDREPSGVWRIAEINGHYIDLIEAQLSGGGMSK